MKPVIKKIKFSKEELDEINKINKGETVPIVKTRTNKNGINQDIVLNRRFTYGMAKKRLTELYGGACIICGNWPDYKIEFEVGDQKQKAKRIERYCQRDFDIRKDGIK